MPIYQPNRVEYAITHGHVQIVREDGDPLPAYWSHPDIGGTFPAIALIHDWWGITDVERRLGNLFAQTGYYVIIPDLFNGSLAKTPQEAIGLVEALGDQGYSCVNTSLQALEHHMRSNGSVAAVGLGMGGSLAYEAALKRDDLEAAVAFYGFPQRYLGHFNHANTPILAIFGSDDPYTRPKVIEQLERELAESPVEHEIVTIPNVARDFFREPAMQAGSIAWDKTLAFLDQHLGGPARPAASPSRL
jgi:carboxymethylenebutenolidase